VLVCPHCRGENSEESRFCNRCGRELEPMQMAMVSRERSDGTTELDMPPPKKPSPVFGIVVLVGLGLAIAGGVTWFALRPEPTSVAADRCQGKFESPLNPYCVLVPEGWRGRTVRTATGALDIFQPTSQEGVGVAVRAGTVVPGVTTGLYAQEIRSTQETAGLSLTDVQGIRVGGEIGATWDFAARDGEGSLVQVRHVVVVRGDVGWRITLEGERDSFEEALAPFRQMLATWTFNYPAPEGGPGQTT
jgi:hypothetical protein